MVKKLLSLIVAAACCLGMCGCGNLYEKEYVVVSDYIIPSENKNSSERISVSNLSELTAQIRALVSGGKEHGSIQFAEGYNGEPSEDLASACWSVRTQDALCAYCVDNISYQLNSVISCPEADINIAYSGKGVPFDEINQIQYAGGIAEIIKKAISNGTAKTAVLVNSGNMTSADVEALAVQIYEEDPIICPNTPGCTVSMFNGSNRQKLYEIRLNYYMEKEELENKSKELKNLEPFKNDSALLGDTGRFQCVMEYFNDASYDESVNTVYDALINKSSGSKGYALGFVALCNKIGLKSMVIEGQYNYSDHYWNLVNLQGNYYHIDLSNYIQSINEGADAASAATPLNDSQFWGGYRWDTSAYPECIGTLIID